MSKIKTKKATGYVFPPEVIRGWDDSDGVNFAVALARVTGWLLHVDWWSPTDNTETVANMKPLRVYVGDHLQNVFDVQGKMKIQSFNHNIIGPLAKKRGKNYGGVVTRFYSENALFDLPLRIKPDEERIAKAEALIKLNSSFIEKIPQRKPPLVPAYLAATYTFARCAIFAKALGDIKGLTSTAIIAIRYTDLFGDSKPGFAHSVCLHPGGLAEDVWGIQTIEEIVARFGIVEYKLDESKQQTIIAKAQVESPEKYSAIYDETANLIKTYCLQ